jgi:hypothetical protein
VKLLSDASYACMFNHVVELRKKNAHLAARSRAAERENQELILLLGMKGYAVETTPDTPAMPAKPGVLTLTKISK